MNLFDYEPSYKNDEAKKIAAKLASGLKYMLERNGCQHDEQGYKDGKRALEEWIEWAVSNSR